MITDGIVGGALSLLTIIFGVLPSVQTMPSWYNGFETYILPAIAGWMSIPVIGTIFLAFSLGLSIHLALLTFKAVSWVLGKVRG